MTSRSMPSDSWPNGVATESDNCKFLNLLFANATRNDLTKFGRGMMLQAYSKISLAS